MKLAVLRKASFTYSIQIYLNLDLEYNIWKLMITDIKLKLPVHRPIYINMQLILFSYFAFENIFSHSNRIRKYPSLNV